MISPFSQDSPAFTLGKFVYNAISGNIGSANQGVMNTNNVGVDRDWFAQNFGGADDIALEDWQRNEQAQDNQLKRDLFFQQQAQTFNAEEAQKQRDYDREMRDSSYTSMIEQLKKAGINPVLAVQHGASYSGGTSAQSGGSRTSANGSRPGFTSDGVGRLLSTALAIGAGLITKML